MSDSLRRRLLAMDRRLLASLLAAGLLFLALEAWMLVLRAPLTELRSLLAVRLAAEATVAHGPAATEIERLTLAIERAERQLRGAALAQRSDDEAVLFLIGALDRVGQRHGVTLGAVRPGGRRPAHGFEATSFEIEAHGSYLALLDWLGESQVAIAPLVPTELTLNVADEKRRLTLKLRVTAYTPPAGTPGGT